MTLPQNNEINSPPSNVTGDNSRPQDQTNNDDN